MDKSERNSLGYLVWCQVPECLARNTGFSTCDEHRKRKPSPEPEAPPVPVALKQGTLYVARHADSDLYKVGFTVNSVAGRLRWTDNPFEPTLIATKPGTSADERECHSDLAKFLVRGEWFRLSERELNAFLDRMGFTRFSEAMSVKKTEIATP